MIVTRVSAPRVGWQADANLQHRFRSATKAELDELGDCCAICREPMESAKV